MLVVGLPRTSTRLAKAMGKVIPKLNEKLICTLVVDLMPGESCQI